MEGPVYQTPKWQGNSELGRPTKHAHNVWQPLTDAAKTK
jgi:hypothetical protein